MAKLPPIVVTSAMLRALWFIHAYRFLAVRQVAEVTGQKEKTASEMLLRLERQRVLGSFGNVGMRGYGKTPKLYYLTPTGYSFLVEHAEPLGYEIGPFRQARGKTRWSPVMYHRLDVIDCLLALERSVWTKTNYSIFETLIEYRRRKVGMRWEPETADYIAAPRTSDNRLVPDAGFVLERTESGRRALFLVEVDRATERLTTTKVAARTQTISYKMQQYDRYLLSDALAAKYQYLGDYAAPVVLFITTSTARIHNIRDVLHTTDPLLHSRYRFSTLEAVRKNFLHNEWLSRDNDDSQMYQLVKG